MTDLSTVPEIRAALAENGSQPHGPARTARAEEIVAAAESVGNHAVLVAALQSVINAYEYGAEHSKLPVPFARLLKLLDDHPDSFTPHQLHNARWYFKWITARLIEIPETPLSAIEGWIREMERRYQAAGFSMRTIAAQDLQLAEHIGNRTRVEACRHAMISLPRDEMSDCAACEANLLGRAHILSGRGQDALTAWSPVLSGSLRCQEEPHVTLAASLLPLLRLGKTGDAKTNHLRGYHLARGNANLASAIGKHLEFCGLTGNEGRGVEILAENWQLLTAVTDPLPRLEFLTGVAVLLQRLMAAGHSGIPVYSETGDSLLRRIMPEITALADRFNARNGTVWTSGQVKQRLEQPPLADQLVLSKAAAARQARPAPTAIAGSPANLHDAVQQARDLTRAGHPDARKAWQQVRTLLGEAGPDGQLAGELAEDQAFAQAEKGEWADAAAGMQAAAGHYQAAGLPGRATAAASRAQWAAVQQNHNSQPWPGLDSQLDTVQKLLAVGHAEPRDLLTVRQTRALVAALDMERADAVYRDRLSAHCAAEAEQLLADSREHGLPEREAAAEGILAGMAGMTGDADTEAAHLRAAAELFERAQRPWAVPQIKARLGELALARSDAPAAIALLEDAITTATQWADVKFPVGPAHVLLAHAYRLNGQADLAVPTSRTGVSQLNRAEDQPAAARARAGLGLALAAAGRLEEADAALTDAVSQLTDLAGEQAAAGTRVTLGHVLRQSGDHRGAAQQFALAAHAWTDGPDQAATLHASAEAALSLAEAGMWEESERAYSQALILAERLSHWLQLVKMHRELAQIAVRDGRPAGPDRALQHIQEALTAGQQAFVGTSDAVDGEERSPAEENPELRRAQGVTCHQAARALAHAERYQDALAWLERAIADLEANESTVDELAQAVYLTASLEGTKLGRPARARERLQAVADRCRRLGKEDLAAGLSQLSSELQ